MELIHESCRMKYIRMVGGLTYATRINLYKTLASLDWSEFYCAFMLTLFDHVGLERRELLVNTVITLYSNRRPLYLDLIYKLKEPQLNEFLCVIPLELAQHFIEVCYYLSPFDKEFATFLELVLSLSFQEVHNIMTYSDESHAKQCRLCRMKRLHTLEYRMQQGQILPEHGDTPGMLVKYETSDNWRADGEHFFTFDYENCVVFWRKKQVDLVKICDGCLNDTHRAMAEVNRFEPVNHLEGMPKKEFCEDLRAEEQARSVMFQQLSVTRLHRRCKEWAILAQKTLREGYIREAKERQAATDKILQDRAEAAKKAATAAMLRDAKRVDKAWMKHEKATQQDRNKKRFDGADLIFKHPYTRENPVSRTLEHPHSWKLAGFDPGGLPATADGASERFGTGKIVPDVRTSELTVWKHQAAYLHKNHLDKVAAEERCKAEERTKEAQMYNKLIADNRAAIERANKLQRLADEQAEEDRVEARAEDRRKRRMARIKAAEEAENRLMAVEDSRSWEHRYYLKECTIIERELRNMRRQETAQRQIDRFWGIPTDIVNRKNAKDVENAVWRAKLETLRAVGMQTAVWVPYKTEVGEFRDITTGLPIKEAKHVKEYEHYRERGPSSNQHTMFNHTYKYEDLETKRLGTAGSTKRS